MEIDQKISDRQLYKTVVLQRKTISRLTEMNQSVSDETAKLKTNMLPPSLVLETYQIMGKKSEILPFPGGRIKSIMLSAIPDDVARLVTHRLRCGSFLVVTLKKQ